MSRSLRDKLRELRQPGTSGPARVGGALAEPATHVADTDNRAADHAARPAAEPGPGLVQLERTLVGDAGDGLTLKQRLERLVAAAARGRGASVPAPPRAERTPSEGDVDWPPREQHAWPPPDLAGDEPPRPLRRAGPFDDGFGDGVFTAGGRGAGVAEALGLSGRRAPLEELVQGRRVENARGEFFLIDTEVPLESLHGQVMLSRFRTLPAGSVPVLAGEAGFDNFDLAGAVFLDTETTGLAGGTGTAAFLVGLAYVEDERFRVRQFFMRDYHEEAALLEGVAAELRRFRHLVTFNGRLFDVPLLESRYRLNRARFPLEGAPHLDLLHPARRLWKARLESCRLQALEAHVLGLRRHGDVPGELIPQLYFDFVRRRDARALVKVFQHNVTDLVSLAALSVLACQWVEGGLAEDPRDLLSLGRVLDRAERHERSRAAYVQALEVGPASVRRIALRRLATQARRAGQLAEAVAHWEHGAREGDVLALRALAIHHEHRTGDLHTARSHATRALECVTGVRRLAGFTAAEQRRLEHDLARRDARLARKLAR
jgi:hypothetical protein